MNILYYSPGQQATIALEILDTAGVRADGYSVPIVNSIILPSLSLSVAYPLAMVKIDTGLYIHKFTLPAGASSVGTYLVSVSYTTPAGDPKDILYQVIVTAPYGTYSASPS